MTTALVVVLAASGFWHLVGGIDPAWIALIGTIFGGVGLKGVEKLLSRSNEARAVRQDFRSEIKDMQARLDTVENEVTFWRNRFYEEQEDNAVLRVMMIQNNLTPPHKKVAPPPAQD